MAHVTVPEYCQYNNYGILAEAFAARRMRMKVVPRDDTRPLCEIRGGFFCIQNEELSPNRWIELINKRRTET